MAVTTSKLWTRWVVSKPHAGSTREILAGMGRAIDEEELQHVLQFLAGKVACHEGATRRRVHHAGAERRHGEDVVDGLYARLSANKSRSASFRWR